MFSFSRWTVPAFAALAGALVVAAALWAPASPAGAAPPITGGRQ